MFDFGMMGGKLQLFAGYENKQNTFLRYEYI